MSLLKGLGRSIGGMLLLIARVGMVGLVTLFLVSLVWEYSWTEPGDGFPWFLWVAWLLGTTLWVLLVLRPRLPQQRGRDVLRRADAYVGRLLARLTAVGLVTLFLLALVWEYSREQRDAFPWSWWVMWYAFPWSLWVMLWASIAMWGLPVLWLWRRRQRFLAYGWELLVGLVYLVGALEILWVVVWIVSSAWACGQR